MPRPTLTLGAAASLVLIIGSGAVAFVQAGGTAYLDNDTSACANCHVMTAHYNGWLRSSHRAVATCNDCHLPSGRFASVVSKVGNGLSHSYAYLSGDYRQPLRITQENAAITEHSCRTCHATIGNAADPQHGPEDRQLNCTQCHHAVGHSSQIAD